MPALGLVQGEGPPFHAAVTSFRVQPYVKYSTWILRAHVGSRACARDQPRPPHQTPGVCVSAEGVASGSRAAATAGTVSGSLRVQAANEWGQAACVLLALALALSPFSQRAFLGSSHSESF